MTIRECIDRAFLDTKRKYEQAERDRERYRNPRPPVRTKSDMDWYPQWADLVRALSKLSGVTMDTCYRIKIPFDPDRPSDVPVTDYPALRVLDLSEDEPGLRYAWVDDISQEPPRIVFGEHPLCVDREEAYIVLNHLCERLGVSKRDVAEEAGYPEVFMESKPDVGREEPDGLPM